MKKLTALLLALIMVFSLATVASADEVTYDPSDAATFNIKKSYDSTETFVPGETLTFTVTADDENPDTPVIVVGTSNTFTVSTDAYVTNEIPVAIPSYDTVGVYRYEIKEVEGNTAGVTTYDKDKTIHVIVLVEYNNETHKLQINNTTCYIEDIDGDKTEEFKNVFKTNDFTVAKDVDGNMANENDTFEVDVTLTSAKPVLTTIKVAGTDVAVTEWKLKDGSYVYTKTLTLSESGGAKTIADVPYGVVVNIAEKDDTTRNDGYTYKSGNEEFTIGDWTEKNVVILNEKKESVETGITLDSMPFVLMLAVAVIGMGAIVIGKKRYEV